MGKKITYSAPNLQKLADEIGANLVIDVHDDPPTGVSTIRNDYVCANGFTLITVTTKSVPFMGANNVNGKLLFDCVVEYFGDDITASIEDI